MNSLKQAIAFCTRFTIPCDDEMNHLSFIRMLPIVGIITGTVSVLIYLLFMLFFSTTVALVISSVGITAFLVWLNKGETFSALIKVIEQLMDDLLPGEGTYANFAKISALQLTVLIKLIAIGTLLYLGKPLFLITAAVAMTTIRAELVCNLPNNSFNQFFKNHWLTLFIATLIIAVCYINIISLLLVLLFCWYGMPHLKNYLEKVVDNKIVAQNALLEISEIIVLLLAVVAIVR